MRFILPLAGLVLLLVGHVLTDGSPEFGHYGRFVQLFAILMLLVGASRALVQRRNE